MDTNNSSAAKTPQGKIHKTAGHPNIQKFVNQYVEHGNASKAHREAFSARTLTPGSRGVAATRLLKNPIVMEKIEDQRQKIQRIAGVGLTRMAKQVAEGEDEQLASMNTRWATEQTHGKATQRHEHAHVHATVSLDLTKGLSGDSPAEEA